MKLAVSHIAWNAAQDDAALKMLQEAGFQGLEIVPPRVAGPEPYNHPAKAAAYAKRMMEEFGLRVCSMQSLWFGQEGSMFGNKRSFFLEYTKSAIRFAHAAGISNLVFGCPKNRNLPQGEPGTLAESFFREVAAYAEEKNSCFALEANPALYGTNLMNHTEEALEMARRVNRPGCRVNLDVGAMVANEEAPELLEGHVAEVNHVHISEPNLLPIEKRPLHRALAGILRREGYGGYISIEMREQPLEVLGDTLSYVKEVFG